MWHGFEGVYLNIAAQHNRITYLPSYAFANFTTGTGINVVLWSNQLTSLPDNLYAGFPGTGINIYLEENQITYVIHWSHYD
eukprot:m.1587389 g.1587389  ORF g.1587389 m.1587389 type:complete len:81 (+) comp25329_c0_seq21:1558-1800(+)